MTSSRVVQLAKASANGTMAFVRLLFRSKRGPRPDYTEYACSDSSVAFCSPAERLTFGGLMESPLVGKQQNVKVLTSEQNAPQILFHIYPTQKHCLFLDGDPAKGTLSLQAGFPLPSVHRDELSSVAELVKAHIQAPPGRRKDRHVRNIGGK